MTNTQIDRSEYALLGLEKIEGFQTQIPDINPNPDTSLFFILATDENGQKVAIAFPFSQIGEMPKALAVAISQFPEGRHIL